MEYFKNLSLESIIYLNDKNEKCLEKWKPIKDYIGLYEVSDLGRVKSLKYKRTQNHGILIQRFSNKGYLRVNLSKKKNQNTTKHVHVLVASSFLNHIPDKYNLVINHKDSNKQNNVLSNLEVVSQRYNIEHYNTSKNNQKLIGVSFHKKTKKYQATIYLKPKRIYLGLFKTQKEAKKAYDKALKKHLNDKQQN